MTKADIELILERHIYWFYQIGDESNRARAALYGADLSRADLRGVDLRRADLKGADLQKANLQGANLRGADLSNANFSAADLRGADLTGSYLSNANFSAADLQGANFSVTNLRGANFSDANVYNAIFCGANLHDADLNGSNFFKANLQNANLRGVNCRSFIPMACPDSGSFIGWKKARVLFADEAFNCLVKLKIPEDAKRLSAGNDRKCRCDKAIVLDIQRMNGTSYPEGTIATSYFDRSFAYKVGETVTPVNPFDDDRWNECSSGIHFYINRQDAVNY